MVLDNLEFGTRKGLSQTLDWDRVMQMDRYNNQIKQQSKLMAEQKAKMFADDFSYTNAMNAHDNPKVKEFAIGKLMEIGSYLRENPDWETNPFKRAMYNAKVHDLKDNPDLNRGLLSDANFKRMQEYMANPKNSDMVNDSEFKKNLGQWDNYLKYGNQFGEADAAKNGKKAFMFSAPEDAVDTTKLLIDSAKDVQYDMRDKFGYQGFRQYVSKANKDLAVEHVLASSNGKYLKKDYEKYLGQFVGNERTNAKTINQFTLERMNPYFQGEKIDKGFDPPVLKAGGDGASASPNMWLDMHKKALANPGQQIDFGSEAMQKTFGNNLGEMNMDGIKDPFGNVLNLGMRKATATGMAQPHKGPGGNVYAEYGALVRLPVEEFMKLGGQYNKAIDEGGVGQILPGGPSNDATNWDIHSEYQNLGFKKYTDDKGRAYVEFPVKQKYDPLNVHLADNYSNAHNVKQHGENPYNLGQGSTTLSRSSLLQKGYSEAEIQEAKDAGYNIQ